MRTDGQLAALLETCATPCYLFDEAEVVECIREIREALADDMRLCYAMKANPFVLGAAARESDYVEACSPGELDICHELGVADDKIVVSGISKEYDAMSKLVSRHPGIHRLTVESVTQYELLETIAREQGRSIAMLLRMTSGNQFGMDADDLVRVARICVPTTNNNMRRI